MSLQSKGEGKSQPTTATLEEGPPGEGSSEEAPGHQPAAAAETSKPGRKHLVLKGGSNAVAIQLFAIDESYEMR